MKKYAILFFIMFIFASSIVLFESYLDFQVIEGVDPNYQYAFRMTNTTFVIAHIVSTISDYDEDIQCLHNFKSIGRYCWQVSKYNKCLDGLG